MVSFLCRRTCACQGWHGDMTGASFSFGCSWSSYMDGCKFACSHPARKFKLKTKTKEQELGNELQHIATQLAPLYKRVAPDAYRNMVSLFSYQKVMSSVFPGFPNLISPKAKAGKIHFGPIKPTNPSVLMSCNGQSSFEIIAILYTHQIYKTLLGPLKLTNSSVRMSYKGQSSFGKPVLHIIP